MDNYREILFPYAYNILGSSDDANDAIQDVVTKHYMANKNNIENEKNYLIKGVINQAINIKNRNKKLVNDEVWLPEPIETETADSTLCKEEILSYSILVLLEKLNSKERAVFILKEAFNYSHNDIALVLDCSIENSRKLLSRAKQKLKKLSTTPINLNRSEVPNNYLEKYVEALKGNDIKGLENFLSEDVSVLADGGGIVKVVRSITIGSENATKLLSLVYEKFQKHQIIKIREINHQPAILYFENKILKACQVIDVDQTTGNILHVFALLDPQKLNKIKFIN